MSEIVQVRNLVDHIVVIPDKEMHRKYSFQPYEVKKIAEEDLRRLAYQPGVVYLFRNSLCIEDKDLAEEFGVTTDSYEHEYQWTQEDIDKCLTEGSLDELLDALDLAPEGIVDTLVQRAVDLKVNDINKRKAILDKTGKNVTSMIDLTEQYNTATGVEEKTESTSKRRRTTKASSTTNARRVQE